MLLDTLSFPVSPIVMGIAIGVVLTIALYALRSAFLTKQNMEKHAADPSLSKTYDSFIMTNEDYRSILSEIDLGVLAFNSNSHLVYLNETAKSMLGPACHLEMSLDDFLSIYGTDNGMKAAVILGKKSTSGIYLVDNRTILLDLQVRKADPDLHFTTLTTYDITAREGLEKQRKQFVANVSHELKTPLTTIVSYSESLLDWGLAERSLEEVRKDLSRIYEDGQRMQKLVNDLSLLTALDSRGLRPRMEEIDLGHLVRYCVDRLSFHAGEKNILIEAKIAPDLPYFFGERSSIERVLRNLIENAIKYSPRQSYVSVFVNYVSDELYIKVKDQGYGIGTENLPLVFNRFYRVDNSGSSIFGGTGLGLPIAKELAELHRGRITVSSQPGSGSEFIVFLPTAERVMREVLQNVHHKAVESVDFLTEAAQQYLLQLAQDTRPELSSLEELTEEEEKNLLSHFRQEEALFVPESEMKVEEVTSEEKQHE